MSSRSSRPRSLDEHARRLRRRELLETLRHDVLPRVLLVIVTAAVLLSQTHGLQLPA